MHGWSVQIAVIQSAQRGNRAAAKTMSPRMRPRFAKHKMKKMKGASPQPNKEEGVLKRSYAFLSERLKVIHPFLFAVYIITSYIASNPKGGLIGFEAIQSLLVMVAALLALLLLLRIFLRDRLKAGAIATCATLLLASYRHVQTLAQSQETSSWMGQDAILLPLWLTLFGFWVFWVLRKVKNPEALNSYLNTVGLIVNVFPIYTILVFSQQAKKAQPWLDTYPAYAVQSAGLDDLPMTLESTASDQNPDIYYIILDAYTRKDVLDEIYAYDNTPFLDSLEARGFYVAEASNANYNMTLFSLSSSLNMMHIASTPEYFRQNAQVDATWVPSEAANRMVEENLVGATLKALGYEIIVFDGGYTSFSSVDEMFKSPNLIDIGFGQLTTEFLLLGTPLSNWYAFSKGEETPLQALFDNHRERILFAMETLPSLAGKEGQQFFFVHILSPHTPFVFGPNGESLSQETPYTLMNLRPGREENIHLYRDQVQYLNTLVMTTIDEILANSETPPIIILQGDHSSKVYREHNPNGEIGLKLNAPILNAYYLPGVDQQTLYPEISPVNTFRVIFNNYFGSSLDLVEDTSYIFSGQNPLDFVEACVYFETCE